MTSYTEYAKKVLVVVGTLVLTLLVPYLIFTTFPHFVPFILAYFTATALDPLTCQLGRRLKIPLVPAVVITNLTFLGCLAFLFFFLASRIYLQSLDLFSYIQDHLPQIQAWFGLLSKDISSLLELLPPGLSLQLTNGLNNLLSEITNPNLFAALGLYTYGLSTAIPNFFFLAIIYFVSVFLFQLKLTEIHSRFYSFFKESSKKKVLFIFSDLRQATLGFLKAQLILSTLTYILSFAGLTLLGVKYAYVIAFFITLVDVLPILGTGSFFVPWAFVTLLLGNTFLAAGLLVVFIIILVIRRALEPKILGESIGLSALATLMSIWLGFKIIGVVGIFLFPLALILLKALAKVGIINLNFKV
ncbi:sporulation integral membrane protein YtvI [Syntrophobotulus glycolicus DSM 8271]|uniref:Sporulation integral membrane protein YtvI n=1 Tax=Syntrophobotulus glycolicus (strain DSM 8271 / FlGlyR) TaxID=645991 RepID=F0SWM8_SYNGF|nr:sporulation integral membrane protein YtvI [Syntrophobotulus glycolicus]ADY56868.1 sporulation integral membrane protein YtvI [Syntrophobotulus glycolicus DSM 8271]